ncbi:MAG TPA: hypothetical protein VFF06_21610 [Polyangia bacterium]|nr:hypothetical protein [Polyangia bacterium]
MRRILIDNAAAALVAVAFALAPGCGDFPSATHLPFPQLRSEDGALLRPLTLVTLVSAGDPDADQLFGFSDALAASDWWKIVGADYALGPTVATARVTGPAITANIADHDVFTYIDNALQASGGAFKNGNSLYLVYLPPGIAVITSSGINTNCRLMAGYNRAFGLKGDNLALVQRCEDNAPIDQLTITASHEILEAATDPTLHGYNAGDMPRSQPWNESVWHSFRLRGRAEVGDLCEGTRWFEGAYVYQRIYSNSAAARGGDPCMPPETHAYYNVSPAQEWFPVEAGATIDVPLHGWTTEQSATWPLSTSVYSSTIGFTTTVPATLLRNDWVMDLQLTAPVGAPSGSFAVVELYSGPNPPIGNDLYHFTVVGAYVP